MLDANKPLFQKKLSSDSLAVSLAVTGLGHLIVQSAAVSVDKSPADFYRTLHMTVEKLNTHRRISRKSDA